MSQRTQHQSVVFWLRLGCFMAIVLGAFLIPTSVIGAVVLVIASGKPLKAGFRIGGHRHQGTISAEALERYSRWKAKAAS